MWILAFVLTYCECAVGARYTKSVADGDRWRAANWGVLFEALLLVDIWFMLSSRWLAIPILCGAWLGVYRTVGKRTTGSKVAGAD